MKELTLTESNNIEYKKLQVLLADIRATYLSMKAEKNKKANHTTFNPADIIDPGIIENALYNSRIEAVNQKAENKHGDEDQIIDFDIHQ